MRAWRIACRDWAVTGFPPRRNETSVYLTAGGPQQAGLLARLGRHRMGRSCPYIRWLADVDTAVPEQLVADSVGAVRRRYG